MGGMGWVVGGRFQREGMYVYLWQIHVDVWHKPTQYCKTAAAAKSLQSCLTLCDPIDGSPAGFPIPGILQARTLEWVAISFSNACMHSKLLQSCLALCNPMDSSPPGSSVHRILQARILECIAISFSNCKTAIPQLKINKFKKESCNLACDFKSL